MKRSKSSDGREKCFGAVFAVCLSVGSVSANEHIDVNSISCASDTHSFNHKICALFGSAPDIPAGIEINVDSETDVTFGCESIRYLGSLQRRVVHSASREVADLGSRATLEDQIVHLAYLARIRSFPYNEHRALLQIGVPGSAFEKSQERVVDVIVQAGSRSLRTTLVLGGLSKTVIERGVTLSKLTDDALIVSIPFDTTGLCFSRRVFIWAQTFIGNDVVFNFEVTWPGLLRLVDQVPDRGAVR